MKRKLNLSFCHLRFDKLPKIIWLTYFPQLSFRKPIKSLGAAILLIFLQMDRIVELIISEHHLRLYRRLFFFLRLIYFLVFFHFLGLRRISFCLFFEPATFSNNFMMFDCRRNFWLLTVRLYWVAL